MVASNKASHLRTCRQTRLNLEASFLNAFDVEKGVCKNEEKTIFQN